MYTLRDTSCISVCTRSRWTLNVRMTWRSKKLIGRRA